MRVLFILCLGVIIACNDDRDTTKVTVENHQLGDSLLITDSSWGPIYSNTTLEELRSIYGSQNIKDSMVYGPEAVDSFDVTFIYPNTQREIIVHWADGAMHSKVDYIETHQEGAPYHAANGLMIGSKLSDLLRVNGKTIAFMGFGWDYGGKIMSYNGGVLEKYPIRFDLGSRSGEAGLDGDSQFDTDMQIVKDNLDEIYIEHISLNLK
jgi:hypothetical protein